MKHSAMCRMDQLLFVPHSTINLKYMLPIVKIIPTQHASKTFSFSSRNKIDIGALDVLATKVIVGA